jgi:outer membrane receptor protein involved in Fe transport
VVTANRRNQTLESVPYSLSVVSNEQLSQAGVTDLASLSLAVPGLSMYDYGSRLAGATVPIIRGINATSEPTRGFRSFEQSPVGVYIDNSPIEGYLQLDDLKQVEVLRGPQGTLYGAGALGGALRLILNEPQLGEWHGSLEAGSGYLAHSNEPSYTFDGMVNVPVGETAALRISAKYEYDPGFINVSGLMKTTGSGVSAIPVLANPSDPINSSGVYYSKNDWNYQDALTSRASFLWKPIAPFHVEVSVIHATVNGDGGPQVNPSFAGGASPIDPNETLPAGGKYQEFSQVDQPYSRTTNLVSLDPSYDAGFATLSATTSYQTTSGYTLEDDTYALAGIDGGAYTPYYAGVPTNPRFVYDYLFTDHEQTFSQEVRLVSKTNPDKIFDYVLGAYYESQERNGAWTIAVPGSPERSAAEGCNSPTYTGAYCQIPTAPGDVNFSQIDTQHFSDTSVFGELTFHFLKHGQFIVGGRHFSQTFTDAQSYDDYTFPTYIPATPHKAPASKTIGKVDLSYEYARGQSAYALWSQGFRRGGANSVPLTGIFQESPLLATYAPDSTNNYEAGVKGRFRNGLTYTFDVFDIKWSKPQISASLPSGNLAVYNANTAESKGFEVESSGPLPIRGFSYNVSAAYADAKLTSDFSLPANDGAGVIVPGLISGKSGEQLPGSPKVSVGANLQYFRTIAPDYDLTVSLNGVSRSPITMNLASGLGVSSVQKSSAYNVFNLQAALKHQSWRMTLYVKNLFDVEETLAPPTQPNELNNLTNDNIVNRPREIGLRLGYSY